ncbi:MAG: glycosyltransferase [Anaerolineales bacterium]|nr:MAG: glycosyltransferase [Anaerolineales bacterium]
MSLPEYSVVVPAYQAEGFIGHCVRALNGQTVDRARYEIIVVDDGSTDGTAAAARKAGADLVLHDDRRGPAAARNVGVDAARGQIVLFTDADCEPSPQWIEAIVAPFADGRVTGCKGTYRTRQRVLMARLVQREFEIRYQRMAELPRIDFIDAYSAAYRRRVLLEYGGFDPTYPLPSAEDVDLAFRLVRDGHLLVFVPQAWVWHRHPARLDTYLARKARYGFWRALLYLRHPEKIAGDAHTDRALKVQFLLVGMAALCALGALLWPPLAVPASLALVTFLATTVPFVRWAWRRDRAVALVWPAVALLRAALQGSGLACGLVYHGLLGRRRPSGVAEGAQRDGA